ncbi:MAG: membrane protein insertase YidC [Bryobacterales bacterium]|nr:membrane protein insertase YidC [Bryobacterales bacterium]
MELRLLLAFLLMGLVLFGTPYFLKLVSPPPAEEAGTPVASEAPAVPATPAEAAPAAAPPPAAAPGSPDPVAAAAEETLTVETDLFRIEFSNRGGVVRSWILKDYFYAGLGKDRRPLELVNTTAAGRVGYPFALDFDAPPAVDLNQALFAATRSDDGLSVEFEYAENGIAARKVFRFAQDSYQALIESEVTSGAQPVPHLLAWRGGFGDFSVDQPAISQNAIYFDLPNNKLYLNDASDAKSGPVTASGQFSFAGISDLYFTAVFLPERDGPISVRTFADAASSEFHPDEEPHVGVSVGGAGRVAASLFVGPKDLDILKKVDPKLEQVVDFGWFGILAKPLFLIMQWVNNTYVNNYGWSIIIVTILINIALFPLKLTSMKSMKRMQALQPQVTAINEKYKGMSVRDPRKQQQQQELMGLYQKHNINPLGGCIPLLLQMPFLFAFYKVFTIAIEMRGASWLWVQDLSRPETLPIRVLPVTMIVTQVLLQKMTPATSADPTQQRMMMIMPLVFGVMFYSMSSGLMLYWLTGNLVAIVQQVFFNRTATAAEVVESVQASANKKKKTVRK